MLLCTS